jgi:hypothetical protein
VSQNHSDLGLLAASPGQEVVYFSTATTRRSRGGSWSIIAPPFIVLSGYVNGVVSGTEVAFTPYGDPAAFSGSPFTFNSAYFTAAWYDGLDIHVDGYLASTLVYSTDFIVNTVGGSKFETFNCWLMTSIFRHPLPMGTPAWARSSPWTMSRSTGVFLSPPRSSSWRPSLAFFYSRRACHEN